MDRRALEIIDMHSADRPIRKLQPDLCNVFHLHLKWRDMSVERPQRIHFSEQIAQIVQWMRERDDHTAAKVRARRVALTIILPGVPLREILAPMRMDG